jgi:molecular chaperone IbpA
MNHPPPQLVRIDPAALRALVGFDTMFEQLERKFAGDKPHTNYPPHNVIKIGEHSYEIQIAVSGFDKSEIKVEVDQDQLIITGERAKEEDNGIEYLYRGLATRNFVKSLTLAEYMEVKDANIKNGILTVLIERIIPEALKPRRIAINGE